MLLLDEHVGHGALTGDFLQRGLGSPSRTAPTARPPRSSCPSPAPSFTLLSSTRSMTVPIFRTLLPR
uniref:Putative glutaredoxin Grx1 n=1 Tax=Phakopsora pachyrhizi TaxID=170000 RepID=A0A0S1MIF4_PHAPC